MSNWAIVVSGLALFGAATSVEAKDKVEPLTQAILTCQAIAEGDARLRCYDQAVPALKAAIDQGSVVLNEQKGPAVREGVVKAAGQSGENSYWIELESGDRWKLLPTTERRGPPQPGSTIKVRKPFTGSGYWISGSDWKESRAEYVGRGS